MAAGGWRWMLRLKMDAAQEAIQTHHSNRSSSNDLRRPWFPVPGWTSLMQNFLRIPVDTVRIILIALLLLHTQPDVRWRALQATTLSNSMRSLFVDTSIRWLICSPVFLSVFSRAFPLLNAAFSSPPLIITSSWCAVSQAWLKSKQLRRASSLQKKN